MPKLQAIGASLRVMRRAQKIKKGEDGYTAVCSVQLRSCWKISLMFNCSQGLETILLFVSSSLMDDIVPMNQIRKILSICPYTEFLSSRFACNELMVMLPRDFTTSGWLVLCSLKVTIILHHLIVSATVFPSVSLSCAWRNTLQYKDKNT